jgi:hypothetical protein
MKGFLLRLRYVLAFQHLMSGTTRSSHAANRAISRAAM